MSKASVSGVSPLLGVRALYAKLVPVLDHPSTPSRTIPCLFHSFSKYTPCATATRWQIRCVWTAVHTLKGGPQIKKDSYSIL